MAQRLIFEIRVTVPDHTIKGGKHLTAIKKDLHKQLKMLNSELTIIKEDEEATHYIPATTRVMAAKDGGRC